MAKNLINAGVLGIGFYVPERIMTNADLEKIVDTSDEWIVERTGIKERRVASPEEATSDLATIAARRALEDAGVNAEEIDLVIVCTLSPDMMFPSTACLVQNNIGAINAGAFDLAAGCSGFVYGLSVACQLVQAGIHKKVLIIGAETLTKVLNWKDRNTCVLFADGAGAAVVSEVAEGYGFINSYLGADGSGGSYIMLPGGGTRNPASVETVNNDMHFIHMDGSETFKFASRVVPEAINKVLEGTDVGIDDVDLFIPHQANLRIIKSAAKRLKQPLDKFFVNIDKYGNTSAGSVGIALAETVQKGLVKKGDNIVLVGFGSGLTWASCVLRWGK